MALAIGHELVAAGETLQHQVDLISSLALSDDVSAATNAAALAGDFGQEPPVLSGERRKVFQLSGERIGQ